MSSRPHLDHNATTRDFQSQLKACTQKEACAQTESCPVKGACGRDYVRFEKLVKWLKSTTIAGSRVTHLGRLLEAAYAEQNAPTLPITEGQICYGSHCCLRVFCILLKMNVGRLVDSLRRNNLVDSNLPINLSVLSSTFNQLKKENCVSWKTIEPTILADLFDKHQSAFCPVKFDHLQDQDYQPNRVIPIRSREVINDKGATASLWQIVVDEEFVGQSLRDQASHLKCPEPGDESASCYVFALKSFKKDYYGLYYSEKTAFRVLKPHEGLVRYLSEYSYRPFLCSQPDQALGHEVSGQDDRKKVYNILLEYGEFDLEEYFVERLPPSIPDEVRKFWKSLFAVADALKGIHKFERYRNGVKNEYYGWHADIKPANILSVQGKFKLADPGFARFEKSSERDQTIISGGTTSYGAPECYRRGTMAPVHRTIDIWSLGCVFSIAATWVVLGDKGIPIFEQARRQAIMTIRTQPHSERPRRLELAQGDYFHDSQEVLKVVRDWHQYLRTVSRKTDTITGPVLDLVDEKMLCGNPTDRVNAEDLCERLNQVLFSSSATPEADLPTSLTAALHEVDKIASLRPVPLPPGRNQGQSLSPVAAGDRDAGKSRFNGLPLMRTTHRSEYSEAQLRVKTGFSSAGDVLRESPVNMQPSMYQHELAGLPAASEPLVRTVSAQASRWKPPNQRKPENIFQALRALEKRQKNQSWVNKAFKTTPVDGFLTRYLNNRDIKFLVDNAETMEDHWDEAAMVLKVLFMKAKGLDKDGMDLSFTNGPVEVQNCNDEKKFTDAMDREDAKPKEATHTDMSASLGDILSHYLGEREKLQTPKKRKYRGNGENERKLTVIVLTDGRWDGMNNKDQVGETIISFLKELGGVVPKVKKRLVTIQFIQLGDDLDASHRLHRLDDNLIGDGIDDIVDTESSRGDVYKMILGSFVEEFDKQNDEVEQALPRSAGNSPDIHRSSPGRLLPAFARSDSLSQSTWDREPHDRYEDRGPSLSPSRNLAYRSPPKTPFNPGAVNYRRSPS